MKYLHWDEKTITDFSEKNVADLYDRGYVFTRKGRGVMQQTRSVRIDLKKFNLSSENNRILKKVGDVSPLNPRSLPLDSDVYSPQILMTAKNFYDKKFGKGIMSSNKVREMLKDEHKSNFNLLLKFSLEEPAIQEVGIGYVIAYENKDIIHYSYPFYHLEYSVKDMGLGMMIRSIEWAKAKGKKYIYLGSLQRPGDVYKLQFQGLEWFDGGPGGTDSWSTDIEKVKGLLSSERT